MEQKMLNIFGLVKMINTNEDQFIQKDEVQDFIKKQKSPSVFNEYLQSINDQVDVWEFQEQMAQIAWETKEKTGKEATIDQISEKMDVPKETISISLESIIDPVSLDEHVFSNENDKISLMDQIESENDESWTNSIYMKDKMKSLSDKEKTILSMRCIKGYTQTEVSKKLKISQAQVSRIWKHSITKNRSFSNANIVHMTTIKTTINPRNLLTSIRFKITIILRLFLIPRRINNRT